MWQLLIDYVYPIVNDIWFWFLSDCVSFMHDLYRENVLKNISMILQINNALKSFKL